MIVQFAVVEAGIFKPKKWQVAKSGGYTTPSAPHKRPQKMFVTRFEQAQFEQARQAQKRVNQQNAREAKHGFIYQLRRV